MKLIGLVGRKRSGKDTVCEMLAGILPNVHRIAFADALKEELAAAMGVTTAYIEEHKSDLRLLLQAWGTEWRRNLCSPTYWIDQTRAKIEAAPEGAVVVVTDVRFPNEGDLIREMGGTVTRVYRCDVNAAEDEHASETAMDDYHCDAVIWNPPGLPQLEDNVRAFATGYDFWRTP